jgi:hypothetical protein
MHRIPTLGFDMRHGDKVTAAIDRRDAAALNRLPVVWFDWRVQRWRRDHEGWMFQHGWLSAKEYGGRLRISRATQSLGNRPVYAHEESTMAKLKVVQKVEEEPVVTKKGRRAAKAAAKEEKKGVGRYTGATTGMSVTEFQNQLMERNFKVKMTDPQLAAAMRREFPEAIDYDEDHVAGIRGAWNKGKHGNIQPTRPLPEFDDTGTALPLWGEKSAARKVAEAEVHEVKQTKLKTKKAARSA